MISVSNYSLIAPKFSILASLLKLKVIDLQSLFLEISLQIILFVLVFFDLNLKVFKVFNNCLIALTLLILAV